MSSVLELSQLISLQNQLVLVTGAAVGIVRAIALRFAEAGADLVLVDIDHKKLEKVGDRAGRHGGKIQLYEADISSERDRDRLWDEMGDKVPDVLVNNAGIYPFKHFLKVDQSF